MEQPRPNRFTYLESAARTTHPDPVPHWNTAGTGLVLYIAFKAFSGTSITFTVQALDLDDSDVTEDLLSTAALDGDDDDALHRLVIAPGVATVANEALGTVAPVRWQLATSGTITSATYSVIAEYINC